MSRGTEPMPGLLDRVLARLAAAPAFVERVEEGALLPAHPPPLPAPPGPLRALLLARESLLAGWTEEAFAAADFRFRLLRRQVCVFNHPDSVRAVFVTHHAAFERKGAMMRRSLEPLLGDGLFVSDGATWRQRRPIVADIVHRSHLPEFAPLMSEAAGALAARWAEAGPEAVHDLLAEMAELTAGIIARSVFGRRLPAEALRRIVRGFARYQGAVDSFNLGYFLGWPEGWAQGRARPVREAAAEVQAVVEGLVAGHLRGEGEAGSILDWLLRRAGEGAVSEAALAAVRNEAATIFMAGHETTAAVLTWAFYLLAKAPWAEAALHAELDAALPPGGAALDDLPRLPYTRAVIEEAMRLYPPVPILPRQAGEAMRIGELEVEKDALVLVCPWLLHRSPDLWEAPHAFRPDRFLGEARPRPYSYIPFSAGPRVCAGLAFAMAEAMICLATLARRFRLVLRPGVVAEPVARLSLRPRAPLLVRALPR
ncbi:cytochrome P450 [Rubritepida flocculans]|uniref:cytochrome P450 n=1 Tax=Rubritepida flocculans TaxID=182403 RepID=UPI000A01B124|nr:cytochrome P450 [Rubritepida flocculans]